MKLFTFSSEDIIRAVPELQGATLKCGCCNWEASEFFWMSENREKALEEVRSVIEDDGFPICGSCMAEMISECGYEIAC